MVRKRVIIGSICCGLIFSQLFALNTCRANTNGEFQYNLKPRNPMEDENEIATPTHTNNNSNINVISIDKEVYQQAIPINIPNQTNYNYQDTETYTYTVPRPEWWEFCPIEFENPKHYKIPITNAQFDNNDWYKLKQEFEGYLADCTKLSGQQRDICYSKLRSKFAYRVSHYETTREKFNNWSYRYTKMRAIDSAIENKNSHIFMFSNF